MEWKGEGRCNSPTHCQEKSFSVLLGFVVGIHPAGFHSNPRNAYNMRTSITPDHSGLPAAARVQPCLQVRRIALANWRNHSRSLPSYRTHARRRENEHNSNVEAASPALLSALTTIGLSGTIAVGGATLCGYQIFNLFRWNQDDIILAFQLNLVLLLLEALLFIPQYTTPAEVASIQSSQQTSSGPAAETGARFEQQQQQQLRLVDMAAVRAAGVWSVSSWQLMLSLYRAVLRRPATEHLPAQVNLGLVLARETSKELLQRGFVLTALAGWLTDRFYEAGFDDVIPLGQGLELTLPQLGFWAASLVATAVFAPVAFIAAEEASESVSAALLLKTEVGQAVAAASSGSSSLGEQQQQQQQQKPATAGVVAAAVATAAAAGDDEEEDEDEEIDPLVLEYRLFKVTEECVASAPAKISYGVTLAKELARLVLLNASFVVTGGNLAASLSSSLLLNSMLLVYAAAAGQQQQQQTGSSSSSSSSST